MARALRTYRIVLELDPDQDSWNVTVPSLPGCFTYGRTQEEAVDRAQEAIRGYLEALAKRGEPIPPPDLTEPAVTVSSPA